MSRYPSFEQLLKEAVAEAGHDDFGPGDFREGLEVLLDSLEHDGDLDRCTDAGVADDLRRRLVNRLDVEAWYREHPEVGEAVIEGPVDVNGLPRTGTTALADMLSIDPQFRCLTGWEQTKPVPPPVAGEDADDPRRQAFVSTHEGRSAEQKAMHIVEIDATMEDT
ncbi:MAG TPA: sulfotransferase, partial [Acidimicrobiales bacterium]